MWYVLEKSLVYNYMYQLSPISQKELQAFYDAYEGDKTFLQSGQFGAWRKAI